ncbi:hypothetical protein VSR01_10175 [Actinacidiphila sp. DG2A-62]|uniref:hypothetical protein n=1 Tax=Actinacidiphila sp. DG2A-62 TaxID=3108821 RepID=UPI002DBBF26F|nr:hypothetical protein [Actinacidiphila sp. DG2A-62]MEC3993890.1 hypothetical protein [Actinacidiphila sp. DG2A-62]
MAPGTGRLRSAVIEVGAWWAVLCALTVVAVGPLDTVEYVVAVAAGCGAALAVRWVRLAAGVEFGGLRGAGRAALLLPWSVLRGVAVLLAALVRPAAVPAGFRRTAVRDGAGPGWAALALAASPDTCVVRAEDGGAVELHTLGSARSPMERALTTTDGPGGSDGPGGARGADASRRGRGRDHGRGGGR